jgi:flagellar assembly protein FliH
MSTRILRGDGGSGVSPVSWQTVPTAQMFEQRRSAVVQKPFQEAVPEPAEAAGVAYQEGLAEGFARARAEAEASQRAILEKMAQTVATLSRIKGNLRQQAESDLLKLSIAIARKVLYREISVDPEALQGLIKVSLEKLQAKEKCRVRIHPSHAAAMQSCLSLYPTGQPVEVTADPALQPGDLVFETPQGDLDVSIESQLAEITRGFADRIGIP